MNRTIVLTLRAAAQAASRSRVQPTQISLALLSLALTIAGTACNKAQPQPPAPPPVVQVMEITTTNAPISMEFIGQLDSPQNVEVRARVEAFVDKMLFAEGTEVKAGAPLFTLDKKPFEQRLQEARGLLAQAKGALNKSEKDIARLTPLAAKHAIPQQDLDNAAASREVAQGDVQTAEARVSSSLIDLGYCDVSAPISGQIGAAQVAVGSLVGKGEPTLLATISQLDPIWFYCNVSEVEYLKADAEAQRTGNRVRDLDVRLVLSDGSTHPAKGRFVFLDRAVDTKTGTIRIRAEFPNPEKNLRPGMFARARVTLPGRDGSILIPERAVQELQGRNFVWLVGPDNKTYQHAVKLGARIGNSWLVEEGLAKGQRIILEGMQKAREGSLVDPRAAEEIAGAAHAQAAARPTQGKE